MKALAKEKDMLEREKWDLRRQTKEAAEQVNILRAQMDMKENRVKELEAELTMVSGPNNPTPGGVHNHVAADVRLQTEFRPVYELLNHTLSVSYSLFSLSKLIHPQILSSSSITDHKQGINLASELVEMLLLHTETNRRLFQTKKTPQHETFSVYLCDAI